MIQHVLVTVILGGTVAGVLLRPGGRSEAWPALAGAVLMALVGAVGLGDLRAAVAQTWDVLLFLVGMMLVAWVAGRAGVFAWLADGCALLARGSGWALFAGVIVLAAAVTALLSLDTTVIMLTPVVYGIATRRRLDPLPMLYACVFIANTGSLLLPVSNLSNLLLYHQLGLGFGQFAGLLWLPDVMAILTTGVVLGVIFRRRIPIRFDLVPDGLPPADSWFRLAALLVVLTLAGLIVCGLAGVPLSFPALAGGGAMVVAGLAGRRFGVQSAVGAITWPVIGFMFAMTVVVRGVDGVLLAGISLRLPQDPVAGLWLSAALAGLGSNVINNLPMAVLALSVLPPAGGVTGNALAVGTLIGVNIGPTLTTFGSLATILWLAQLRERRVGITVRDYLRVAVVTTPIVMLITLGVATLRLWW